MRRLYIAFQSSHFRGTSQALSSQAVVMVETWLRIGHQKSCWRVIATVVLNRGDSANGTACSDKPKHRYTHRQV